ncbi:hypothetical protein [Deinococcus aquaedulcis]|uniref:hypothetical protein n=1 Tax=Deinococcus aquaedulcis TaxID=2840455 RepID=UPI001C82E30B|nr:hypothetical protein [Deinococcus aquaedulcis]
MSAAPCPPAARRYLRRLTLLLPPQVRPRVVAEVHAHLHGLAHDAQVRGLPEAQAWAHALQQAGPVWPAALRLAGVYLGRPLRAAVLVGAALGGAAYAVQGSLAAPLHVSGQP